MAVTYQQLGNDATTNNNFTLRANGDGTLSLCKGTVASPTQIAKFDASGNILGCDGTASAAAGYVGELTESNVASGSAVALTTNTAKTVTSISITAGDWDVWGAIGLTSVSGLTSTRGSIHTATNTMATAPNGGAYFAIDQVAATVNPVVPVGIMRILVSSTTTIYLVALATFTTSASAYGYIGARRVR